MLASRPNQRGRNNFDPPSFRAILKFRSGISLMDTLKLCPDCSKPLDKFGPYALDKHNSSVLMMYDHFSILMAIVDNIRGIPGNLSLMSRGLILRPLPTKLRSESSNGIRFDFKKAMYAKLGADFNLLIVESTGGCQAFSIGFFKK